MIRQIDDGGSVGRCRIVQHQRVFVCKRIAHRKLQVSRKAVLSVGTHCPQHQAAVHDAALVHFLGKCAVQMVRPVVGFQFICFAIQCEARFLNAVGIAADERAEYAAQFVILQLTVAQRHVTQLTGVVLYPYIGDDAAVLDDSHTHARGVFQNILVNLLAVLRPAIIMARDRHRMFPPTFSRARRALSFCYFILPRNAAKGNAYLPACACIRAHDMINSIHSWEDGLWNER